MKTLTILEGNLNLAGVVIMIIGAIILAALVFPSSSLLLQNLFMKGKETKNSPENNLFRPC